jgi:metal-sulfur cluster biosynthetic enzyme
MLWWFSKRKRFSYIKRKCNTSITTSFDPEMDSINVYDLGLIYLLDVKEDSSVYCEHTLTSMVCPFADQICQDISDAIKSVDGVTSVERKLVFEPIFTMDMVSEDGKMMMGLLY